MPFQKGNKLAKGGRRHSSGAKPLLTRELCQKSFHERIRILNQIADDGELDPRDRIAALKVLGSVGIPAQHEHSGPDGAPIPIENVVIEQAIRKPE